MSDLGYRIIILSFYNRIVVIPLREKLNSPLCIGKSQNLSPGGRDFEGRQNILTPPQNESRIFYPSPGEGGRAWIFLDP